MTVNCLHDTSPEHIRASFLSVCVAPAQVLLVTCLREQTPTTPSMWLRGGTVRLSCYWGESACVCVRENGGGDCKRDFIPLAAENHSQHRLLIFFSNLYDASCTVDQGKYLNHFTVIEYIRRSTTPIFFFQKKHESGPIS